MGKFRLFTVSVALVIVISLVFSPSHGYGNDQVLLASHHAPADSSDPPTIEWYPTIENSTEVIGVTIDAIYTGQSEQVFSFDFRVNDSDGVDFVIFRFYTFSNWINRTTTRISGDEIDGQYAGNITFTIAWDSINNLPSPRLISFSFKIFANDTLGNWAETVPTQYSYYYLSIMTPTTSNPGGNQTGSPILEAFLITGIICVVGAVVVLVYLKSRQKA
ncbi:hypothetical protein EU527_17650 [Candidatus Thorarchaeota archaeon]|nr:MAG: hypothetical protein EU527_17650 [Candidatus Thorarchaeota archaeon]